MKTRNDDLIIAQIELIERQRVVINKQTVEINQLKQQVDTLVDSVNWYENETKHNATFEKLRDELESVRAENTLLKELDNEELRNLYKTVNTLMQEQNNANG